MNVPKIKRPFFNAQALRVCQDRQGGHHDAVCVMGLPQTPH